eukprot:scaffold231743_cov37-Prasinocladus_malaysianus.AAC.1
MASSVFRGNGQYHTICSVLYGLGSVLCMIYIASILSALRCRGSGGVWDSPLQQPAGGAPRRQGR